MASLTSCMGKAGKALRIEDREAILARFSALTEAGATPESAARMAVDEQIATVRALIAAEQGSEQPTHSAMTVPKVYKTRAGAEAAKTGNTERLRKIDGGYILRKATDKELAAADRNGRRLASSGGVDVERDSLLMAIAKLGGIRMDERSDTIGEGNKNVGGKMLFTKDGGSIDDLGNNALSEFGFIPADERSDPTRWLRSAIRDEFMGIKSYHSDQGTEWMQDAQTDFDSLSDEALAELSEYDLEQAGYNRATPEVQAATEQLMAEAESLGIDTESIREDAVRLTEGQKADDYELAIQEAIRQAVSKTRADTARLDASATQRGGQDRGETSGEESQQEGLTLQAQDAEDLRTKTTREQSGRDADTAEQRRLAAKAKADAEVGDFTLTGSDRAVDVGAAAGQRGIFDEPAVVNESLTTAPAATPESATPSAPEKAAPSARLTDAGEELIRNRRGKLKGLAWDDVSAMNDTLKVAQVVKSNVWPRPDYAKMVEDGAPAWKAAALKAVYDKLAAAPVTRAAPTDADLRAYIETMEQVREALTAELDRVAALPDGAELWKTLSSRNVFGKVFPVPADARPVYGAPSPFDRVSEQGKENNRRALLIGGNNAVQAMQFNHKVLSKVKDLLSDGFPAKQESWQKSWEVRQTETRDNDVPEAERTGQPQQRFYVYEKGSRWRLAKGVQDGGYATQELAEAFARSLTTKKRDVLPPSRGLDLADAKRTGPDWRNGKDVTAEQVMAHFGFRGVNLGEYVKAKQGVAQVHLNHVYDAFSDLADLLGAPPKAMSLNGTLGVAVGAQGSGKALAHFVPGVNEINITRDSGAGALAHEFGHAVDHYFATQHGRAASMAKRPYLSAVVEGLSDTGGVRLEVMAAMRSVMKTLNSRPMTEAEARKFLTDQRELNQRRMDRWVKEFSGNKGADPAALAAVAEKLKRGDVGEAQDTDVETNLAEFMRAAGLKPGNAIAGNAFALAYRLRDLADEARFLASHIPQVDTDYSKASAAMDAKKASGEGYWSTPWEKFARAFETFAMDALKDRQRESLYLSGLVDSAGWQSWSSETGKAIPYPAGTERLEMQQAFQRLVDTIQTRTDDDGNVAMLSRAAPPQVAVSTTPEGHPEYATQAVTLAFPQETERFEVIPETGQQILSYAIMPADGFDVLGHVELLMNGGQPVSLLDIEVYADKGRQAGVGRATIEALLAAHPGADLNISNIVPEARGFWERMGVPQQNVEGAYDGTLNWQTYSTNRGAAGGNTKASRGARGQGNTGREGARSSSAQGRQSLDLASAQRLADGLAAGGLTRINVVGSVADLPAQPKQWITAKAPDGRVRGAYLKGTDQVWMFTDNIATPDEFVFVALHEAFHRGLHKVIPESAPLLTQMYRSNKALKAATDAQVQLHKIGQLEAIEEALADMAGAGTARDLSGWDKLLNLVRDWLGKLAKAAGVQMTWTDDMVADFVAGIRAEGLKGGVHVDRASGVTFSRENQPFADFIDSPYDGPAKEAMRDLAGLLEPMRDLRDGLLPKTAQVRAGDLDGDTLDMLEQELGQDVGDEDTLRLEWRDAPPDDISGMATIRVSVVDGGAMLSRSFKGMLNDARDINLPAQYKVGDFFNADGKVHWWHKTVGTMHNLAERSPLFKRVYDAVQNFVNDVSYYATEAADLAPRILPKLEHWKDILKSPIKPEDAKAIASPIFEGTLNWMRDSQGQPVKVADVRTQASQMSAEEKARAMLKAGQLDERVLKMWQGLPMEQFESAVETRYSNKMLKEGIVWTDAELRARFNLGTEQIGLYREFRAAVDKSVDSLAVSHMLRFAGEDAAPVRRRVLAMGNAERAAEVLRDYLFVMAENDAERRDVLNDTANKVIDIAAHAKDMSARGYAPLSRFGEFTLDVVDTDGERVYFGLFESPSERTRKARQLKEQFPAATITVGTTSQEAYRLFAGVGPETLELFGEFLGLENQGSDDASKAFQQYIKLTKSTRSAMRRLIERKGIAGFSEDAGRVLAGFVYSNARQTASNLHMGEMSQAAADIPKGDGQLQDAAVKLVEYVKNPQEEAQTLRGWLFAQYLGGSVASALVNMTQPATVTLPYLSQFGGAAKAAKRVATAARLASKTSTGNEALDKALRQAEEDGIVAPQEVHQLQAQAMGRGSLRVGDGTTVGNLTATGMNKLALLGFAWGKLFGMAELVNRRITFIASYNTALAEGMVDPAGFAAKAVTETQFTYNKGNKPRWARGAVGSVAFTFKQYSISYMELLNRMWNAGEDGSEERRAGRKAVLLALAVLMLAGGADGLPFMQDVEDVIDGLLQRLGFNFSTKQARREFLVRNLGDGGAQFVSKGLSGLPGAPIDVSGRMGMGNLLPGTGLLTKKTDYSRDVAEFAGPAADLATRAMKSAGQVVDGEIKSALTTILPTAGQNLVKSVDMAKTGMYRDEKGRKVLDVDGYDVVSKGLGFQPRDVAKVQDSTSMVQRMIAQTKIREAEIASAWAQGIFEKDPEKVKEARAALARWNENNPAARIRIDMPQILKRVRAMNQPKAERIAKTAPKEMRAQVREALAEGGE